MNKEDMVSLAVARLETYVNTYGDIDTPNRRKLEMAVLHAEEDAIWDSLGEAQEEALADDN